MGRGLVEPVDDMRLTNPATNEALLDWLSREFAANGFDLRRLTRTILTSRSYQVSSRPNSTNREDDRFYSRFLPKRLPAEVLLDAVCQVTGQPEKFPGVPSGSRAISLPDTQVHSTFMDIFGRPARQVTCECERNMEPNVAQALHLISAETINRKVAAKGGLVDRLLAAGKSNTELIDEIYLATLCRKPTAAELRSIQASLQSAEPSQKTPSPPTQPSAHPITQSPSNPLTSTQQKSQVFADLLWALLSGPEFVFNH
jgi:hypothetical protein